MATCASARAPKKKLEYVHTLNASGLATSRVFPALLEQNQMGGIEKIEPLKK